MYFLDHITQSPSSTFQGDPLLLGEVRDVTIAGRVALDFAIHLNLDKKGVKER